MDQPDLVVRAPRVVTLEGVRPASVHIREGRITAVTSFPDVPSGCKVVDVHPESVLMPGLVDTHVHVNEPGRTEWEGFETATRAAAAGGVTTIVDMPLNSIPPTTTLDGFREKLRSAEGKCLVDVGFWGGVVPGNTGELAKLWKAGVVGFKCFLVHSGVDEFPSVSESELRQAMPELARLGAVLIVHAELPGPIERACQASQTAVSIESSRSYRTFLRARPREAENEAVALMVRLSQNTACRVHIVHHSSADALEALREAKASGLPITAETCPHYLFFAAEEVPDGATEFKCCPPIRERENRERLWEALGEGTIEMVVSDHSPCPPEMKLSEAGDFMNAWGGISSLQLRLPVMWTEARRRGLAIDQLVDWLCGAPARLAGLDGRKGAIAVGRDADLVIWNPDSEFRVEPQIIHHRHKLTPYRGTVLRGVVEKTLLRGQMVYDGGEFGAPRGLGLLRPRS
jgi:allantoinase